MKSTRLPSFPERSSRTPVRSSAISHSDSHSVPLMSNTNTNTSALGKIEDILQMYQYRMLEDFAMPCELFFTFEYMHVKGAVHDVKYIEDAYAQRMLEIRNLLPKQTVESSSLKKSFGSLQSSQWDLARKQAQSYVRHKMLIIALTMTEDSRRHLRYFPDFYELQFDEFQGFVHDILCRIAQVLHLEPEIMKLAVDGPVEQRHVFYKEFVNIIRKSISDALNRLVPLPVEQKLKSPSALLEPDFDNPLSEPLRTQYRSKPLPQKPDKSAAKRLQESKIKAKEEIRDEKEQEEEEEEEEVEEEEKREQEQEEAEEDEEQQQVDDGDDIETSSQSSKVSQRSSSGRAANPKTKGKMTWSQVLASRRS